MSLSSLVGRHRRSRHQQRQRGGGGRFQDRCLLLLTLQLLVGKSAPVVWEKCVDHYGNNYGYSEACAEITLDFEEADVDMQAFQDPEGFDLEQAVHNITDGSGYYLVRQLFSPRDVEMARDRVLFYENPYAGARRSPFVKSAEFHNNYHGLLWGLLNKGRIFEKMAQHPAILAIARRILGPNCQISSLAANTVLPGMMSQQPHIDYPYYDYLFPSEEGAMATNHLLSVQFVILLTNFTVENGGTAIRPQSHLRPAYPDDADDFFRNSIQMEGRAGDMVVFAGPIQHCAMANKAREFRTGILQHMVPVYVKPFEDILVSEEVRSRASADLRRILALDHPYPARKTELNTAGAGAGADGQNT